MASDPSEVSYPRTRNGRSGGGSGRLNPSWPDDDVRAKAEALTQVEVEAARAVLIENRTSDEGMANMSDPAADRIPTWLIRGDPAAGGLVPDAALGGFEARIGADHVVTLAGAPHSPQRTHPSATTAALLRALG